MCFRFRCDSYDFLEMKGSGDKSKGKKPVWFDAENSINRAQRVWRESIDEFFTKLDEVITEGDDYYRDTQTNRNDEYYQGPFKLLESRLVACKAVHNNKVSLSKNKTTHVFRRANDRHFEEFRVTRLDFEICDFRNM